MASLPVASPCRPNCRTSRIFFLAPVLPIGQERNMNLTATPGTTPATPSEAAAHFARCLDAVFAPLALLVAARFRLLGHWTVPLWIRLNRANRRLAKLLAHLAAGRLTKPRAPTSPPSAPRSGGPPPLRLPTRRFWLVILLRHEAAAYMHRLEIVLNNPATASLLAANPDAARRIARTLAPLCQILGVTNPHAPPRKPRRRRPRPRAATIPKPRRSRALPEPPPALTADGYMIPPSASPPAWPPIPRISPNLLNPPPPPDARDETAHDGTARCRHRSADGRNPPPDHASSRASASPPATRRSPWS